MELPIALAEELRDLLKEEYWDFQTAMGEKPHGGLRFHSGKIKGGEETILGLSTPVPWTAHGWYTQEDSMAKHPYYHGGIFYLQEPSAMLPAEVLHPEKGDWVIDLCAAPGGKSTRLAEFLNGTGFLLSNDISNTRCRGLLRNMELFGMKNAVVTNETPQRLANFFGAAFDKVLVDAPCSGQGMFRKDPKLLKEYISHNHREYAKWQREILESASALTAVGGSIVYSTCTFSLAENEDIIAGFLKEHPDFSLIEIPKDDGFVGGFRGFDKTVRLLPHKVAGEGHFVAHLQKVGEKKKREIDLTPPKAFEESEIFKVFCEENQIHLPSGIGTVRKNSLYLKSKEVPDCYGLKVVGSGTYLGDMKNNRFIPSHPFALSLKKEDVNPVLSFPLGCPEIEDYLKCLTLKGDGQKGYHLIFVDDFPLGWVKSDGNGTLKNHYPKVWRNI